jgi:hypothetical protein
MSTVSTSPRRCIGREHRIRELRTSGELHRRIAQAINCGELGYAMDHPVTKDGDLARALLEGILGGAANGYAAQGFPQAAGGVDVSAAIMSVRPGIRKIKKLLTTQVVPQGTNELLVPLPKAGYLERPILRIRGLGAGAGFQIVQGATAQATP